MSVVYMRLLSPCGFNYAVMDVDIWSMFVWWYRYDTQNAF